MTLIAAFVSADHVRVIGDVLVTDEGSGVSEALLHPTKIIPFGKGPSSVTALIQKVVIISPQKVVLWAGNVDKALRILRVLEEADRTNVGGNVVEVLREFGLEEEDWVDVSIIFIEVGEQRISHSWINAAERRLEDGLLIFAGSGASDFLTGIQIDDPALEPENPTWQKLMMNVARAIGSDDFNNLPRSADYGAWFEVVDYANSEFQKIPLAMIRWDVVAEDMVDLRSSSLSYYDGFNVIVETTFYKDTPEVERAMRMISPDPLWRTPITYERVSKMTSPDRAYRHSFHIVDGQAAEAVMVAYCGHSADDLTFKSIGGLSVGGTLYERVCMFVDRAQRPANMVGVPGKFQI